MKIKNLFLFPFILGALSITSCTPSSNGNNKGSSDPEKFTPFLSGEGVPSDSIGNNLDLYIKTSDRSVYCKEEGHWVYTDSTINENLIGELEDNRSNRKIAAIARSLYSTNLHAESEMRSDAFFTHQILHLKNQQLFNEVYTNEEAYEARDKEGAYYQYQKVTYENNKYYIEIQGGEKQEFDPRTSTSLALAINYYNILLFSFNYFQTTVDLLGELGAIATGAKNTFVVGSGDNQYTFSNFVFAYDSQMEYLTSFSYRNVQYGTSYEVNFSNFGNETLPE